MNDWVHWVNANDAELGRMTLTQVHERKLLHRLGVIFIQNEKKETLLIQRAENREPFPGLTDASISFHVHATETVLETAKRELFAQTGLRIEPAFLGFSVVDRDPDHVIVHVFELTYDGIVQPQSRYAKAGRYLPADEINRGLPREAATHYLQAAWKILSDARKKETQKQQRDELRNRSLFIARP